MDNIAIVLSVMSTIVALISAYIAQFKKGSVVIPPIRAYRLEPLNFHVGDESYRAVRMYIMVTFMNTGAQSKAVNDMRVRIPIDDEKKELFLSWEDECPALHCSPQDCHFAPQLTLAPYESVGRVYSFVSSTSDAEQGKLVSAVEKICKENSGKVYRAYLETRDANNRWRSLYRFAFHHSGRHYSEQNFAKINIF